MTVVVEPLTRTVFSAARGGCRISAIRCGGYGMLARSCRRSSGRPSDESAAAHALKAPRRILAAAQCSSSFRGSARRWLERKPGIAGRCHAGAEAHHAGGYQRGAMIAVYGARMRSMGRRKHANVVWIEKEALLWFPASIERAMLRGVPYVLDCDDALFHNYDLHRLGVVRRVLGRRIDAIMAGAALVTAGNEYLAQRARDAGAKWVKSCRRSSISIATHCMTALRKRMPCPHRVDRFADHRRLSGCPGGTAAAAGRASSFQAARHRRGSVDVWRGCGVRAVDGGVRGGIDRKLPGRHHAAADSPWERGKCGYKLIQYMACGLPVVASPIGVNEQIVRDGENGYLADGPEAWSAPSRPCSMTAPCATPWVRRDAIAGAGVQRPMCCARLARLLKQAGASDQCGFAGFSAAILPRRRTGPRLLEAMANRIRHRGPDDGGTWTRTPICRVGWPSTARHRGSVASRAPVDGGRERPLCDRL